MNLVYLAQLASNVTDAIAAKMAKISGGTENAIVVQTAGGDAADSAVLVSALEVKADKGAASGYCPLNASTKVDSSYLPDATAPEITFAHVITGAEITAKKVVFASIGSNAEPAAATNFSAIFTTGGLTPVTDFALTVGSGAEFDWDGLTLDGLIIAGNTITFTFGY